MGHQNTLWPKWFLDVFLVVLQNLLNVTVKVKFDHFHWLSRFDLHP